jgi:hypothetical protein
MLHSRCRCLTSNEGMQSHDIEVVNLKHVKPVENQTKSKRGPEVGCWATGTPKMAPINKKHAPTGRGSSIAWTRIDPLKLRNDLTAGLSHFDYRRRHSS